ncbi:Small G protein signaling modulator 1 [Fasciola hepatica]|uniref:Small G protein signaling modulator 1 n=1 Tax=Fasciola hepatica TaxID=6192 RepID=A0A4E0RHD7_FASHE|nr:Small G protein signaling modulator 1 [Fasciola hepatica]
MREDPGDTTFAEPYAATESFTFFGIRKTKDNDSFREKRRVLLEDLKKDVKRLMEEAATRNSLPENSGLVLSFCVNAESCLRFGLRNCAPHFYREPSVIELLQKLAPKCPEATVLLGYLSNSGEKTKSASAEKTAASSPSSRSFLSILSPNKPVQSMNTRQPSFKNSTNPHWIHLALMEKLLQPVVYALFGEAKNFYQCGSIMTTNSDARIFLSLLSGPCSLNYTIPTLEDPYWSTLHADELLERHRFISLSTQTFYENQTRYALWKREQKLRAASQIVSQAPEAQNTTTAHSSTSLSNTVSTTTTTAAARITSTATTTTTPRVLSSERSSNHHPTGQRFVFDMQQHSSTSSNSSATNGGIDGLYQPRRHQLMYAKNNVLLGDTRPHPGYLAVYCNLSGVNLRWTSNELLLQASSLLHQNTQPGGGPSSHNDEEEDAHRTEHPHHSEKSAVRGKNQATLVDGNGHPINAVPISTAAAAAAAATDADVVTNEQKRSPVDKTTEDEVIPLNSHGWHRTSLYTGTVLPTCLNIALKDIEYIHCHSNFCGVLIVFVATDGIQYPPIRIPGGLKPSMEFLSSVELGLAPNVRMEPTTETVRNDMMSSGNHSASGESLGFDRQIQPCLSSDASPGPPNPFQRLIHFCSLKPNRLTTVQSISGENPTNWTTEDGEATKEDPVAERSGAAGDVCLNDDKDQKLKEPEISPDYRPSSELVFRLVRNENSPDPFLDKPADSESLEPTGPLGGSGSATEIVGSIDTLSDALDAIKRELMAKAFYTWLTHSRYMKVIKTHLVDSVLPGTAWSRTPTTPLSLLTESKWNQLFWNLPEEHRAEFDATPIYEHIYQAGCDENLRIQVWPYLLQVFDWSMTEAQKRERFICLKEHYQTALKEWMELEELIIRGHPEGAESLPTSAEVTSCPKGEERAEQTKQQQHVREEFARVLESVQKDVVRCDRNHHLFHKVGDCGPNNLAILRRVLITYVWEHLEDGYTQGMCDLIAPLLALLLTGKTDQLDVEVQTYSFFVSLMKVRLGKLYCSSTSSVQMDRQFASLRALVQVMDPELNAHIQMYGDFTHFYFCYRWFLLDFKREFKYGDVFRVWETLIAASHLISDRFELFVALALIQYYRDVIIRAQMEFTDILKFFNERAEKHSVEHILDMARKSASEIQDLLMTT